MRRLLLMMLVLLSFGFYATAQTKSITGKVTDSTGAGLQGATVTVKGTSVSVMSQANGDFTISNAPSSAKEVVVSFVGYEDKTVKISGSFLTIRLESSASKLEDVVVTGFQKINKKNFTGSAVTLKADDVKLEGVADVSRMLEGRAAGVIVQNVSSTFGSAPKIRIRSATSINGDNKPLWVIDGVVQEDLINISNDQLSSGDPTTLLGSSIAGINANDIESFDILKDASATALYGARAMNGVVVITTKKGRVGNPVVSYSGNFSTQLKPKYSEYNIMNSAQQMSVWANLERFGALVPDILSQSNYGVYGKMYELLNADENGNFPLQNTPEAKNAFLKGYAYKNTDWFDVLFKNSLTQEHSLSISQGSQKSQTFFSTSFYTDNGWTIADKVNRYTLNFNNNYNFNDKLSAGFQTVGSVRQQKAPGTVGRNSNPVTGTFDRDFDINPFSYALNTSRAITAFDENGNREYFRRNYAPFNILTELENNRLNIDLLDLKLQGNLGYKFNKNLRYDFVGAIRYVKSKIEHEITENSNMANAYRAAGNQTIRDRNKFLYRDPDNPESLPEVVLPYGGFYNTTESNMMSFDIRNSLSYEKVFNSIHDLKVLGGQQVRAADRQNLSNTGYGYQYDNGGIPFIDPRILKQTIESNFPYYTMGKTYDRFVAFYLNAQYTFDKKYSLYGTVRYDGTNQLGSSQNARWLPTWSFGGAWNVEKEKFMEDVYFIDYLKIRASYGLVASMGAATNSNVVLKNSTSNRPYATERESVIQIVNLENSDLTWEKSYSTNFGFDIGLMKNRLYLVMDFWQRKNFDLIGPFKTSGIGGEGLKLANYADMVGKGVDVTLGGTPFKSRDWTWTSNVQFGYNTTKITNSKNEPLIFDLVKAEGGNLAGYPVNGLFSIDYAGLIANNGAPIFIDEDGIKGSAVYMQAAVATDANGLVKYLKYEGQVDPKYTGGFNNTFSYKNISLNVFLSFQGGNKIRLANSFKNGYSDFDAMPKEFYDRWIMPGEEVVPGVVPSILDAYTAYLFRSTYAYNNYNYSSDRVADGGFIRLKTVSLSYRFEPKTLSRIGGFKSLSVMVAAVNPWLIYSDSKLKGQDPEFFNVGGVAQPIQKQITLSIKAGL